MPPDPNLIVHEVFSWVVPGLITIILGFPIVRLITKSGWSRGRSSPHRGFPDRADQPEGGTAQAEECEQ